ncbi:hypothetical protein G5714_008093 [Onychostoma macrolepis]|uniref:trypsin n=1 Tax=Onychostoma macrolepis TaxID=369639 RepID=A0A7J6CYK7_9TELE|nr:hypothetical protein G5714_008093 [Onychostoma macrolepis]
MNENRIYKALKGADNIQVQQWPSCGSSPVSPSLVQPMAVAFLPSVLTSHRVILGEHDRSSNAEAIQTISVGKSIKHPNYNSFTINNDIILIKLASAAKLNTHVSPVCLPGTSDNFPGGMKCVTSGWGLTRHNAPDTPALLQQAALPLLTNDDCKLSSIKMCDMTFGSNVLD